MDLPRPEHRLVQADVLQWLKHPDDGPFDLIVIDPPTFSNSKRMETTLDTQRDHVWILNQALELCAPGAEIWFSTNYRKFKLSEEHIAPAKSKTSANKPYRLISGTRKKIHYCFRIWK